MRPALYAMAIGICERREAAVAFTAQPAQAALKRITVGTNPQGTLYFVVGGGFSKLFSDKLGIQSGKFRLRDVTFETPSGCYGVLMGKTTPASLAPCTA